MIHFILGGISSGKTAHGLAVAEASNSEATSEAGLIYVATAMVQDDEMKKKAANHVAERLARQKNWQTVEEGLDLLKVIKNPNTKAAVLVIDSLALWLFNIINAEKNILEEGQRLVAGLKDNNNDIIIVSDEINFSPIANNAETRIFCQSLGLLHQQVAGVADHVELMVAGLPHKIK